MIDYRDFADRLAAGPDRAARWDLLREVQRDWGFIGAGSSWEPTTPSESDLDEYLEYDEEEFADFDPADEDHGYATVVPAALDEWFALPENSFRQAPRLYRTHPMNRPGRWPVAREAAVLRHLGVPADAVPPFHGLFMSEYGACFSWGYRESEAAVDDDPPVYVLDSSRPTGELLEDLMDGGGDPTRQRPAARSITEWALGFALATIPFGAREQLRRDADRPDLLDPAVFDHEVVARQRTVSVETLTGGQRAALAAGYPSLGLLPWQDLAGGLLRGGPGVILKHCQDDGILAGVDSELRIAARDEESLAAALATLGLDEPSRR